MALRRSTLALSLVFGWSTVAGAAPPHHKVKHIEHRHVGHAPRLDIPRPALATVAYAGVVPYVAPAPPSIADAESFFLPASFLGAPVLAATVPPPQPHCIPRHAVSAKTQHRPPWALVGPLPIYCEIVGP